jgi:hypothetical protein
MVAELTSRIWSQWRAVDTRRRDGPPNEQAPPRSDFSPTGVPAVCLKSFANPMLVAKGIVFQAVGRTGRHVEAG